MSSTFPVLVLVLPYVLRLPLSRTGDTGPGHLERVENGIELLPGEHLVAQNQLADRLPGDVRLACDTGGRLVAHMRVDGRDHADAAVDVSPHPLSIGGESLYQVLAEDRADVGHDADRLEQVEYQPRLHHVQLELASLRGKADSIVVANDLESHLVHHLRHHWIHLARHDTRARLPGRQIKLAEAAAWPRGH